MMDALPEPSVPLTATSRGLTPGTLALLTPCDDIGDIRTIVCGQSHAWALSRAIVNSHIDGVRSPGPDLARRHGVAALGLWGHDNERHIFGVASRLARGRNLALMWRGNQHNSDFLFIRSPLFDFVPADAPDCQLEESAILVPEAVIRAHFQPTNDQMVAVFEAAGSHDRGRHFVLGTPPPLFDSAVIAGRLQREPMLLERAQKLGIDASQLRITPASIRLKMWRILQTMMAEIAGRVGGEFVPFPAEVQDADGFLDVGYSAGDVTHATIQAGVLMLQALADRLGRPAERAAA